MDEPFRPKRSGSADSGFCRESAADGSLGLAHDFRNLLQLAASTGRVVRRELLTRSDEKLAGMLGDALDALERANLLAQRLSGPGALRTARKEVLLQQIVPELRSILSAALGSEIMLESLVAEDLPALRCDRLQLESAVLNLVLNARQAMPRGGTLVIEAVPCTDGNHRGCIALSVTDSGLGMAPDVAEKAFEPFFSTRLLDGGNGVGLYNVRAFAEALGGSVQLSTREKEGTRVSLHLPAYRRASCSDRCNDDRFE